MTRVAIVLDGTIRGTHPLAPGRRTTKVFRFSLPNDFIHQELDVLALPHGESLLGLPHPLAGTYALATAEMGHDGLYLTGSFTAGAFMARDIGVEWLAGDRLVAPAVAHRGGELLSVRVALARFDLDELRYRRAERGHG